MREGAVAAAPKVTRRAALGLAAAAPLAGIAALACRRAPSPPAGTVVPLAALPVGERVRVLHDEMPVELVRQPDGSVTARSLWCTHVGCEVTYRPETDEYECPCHDGRFAADGAVLGGPPTRPLRTLPTHLEADRLILPFESL